MASNIDFSVPVFGTPTTDSVRDQFHTAYIEITELQDRIAASRPAGAVNQIQYNAGGFPHPAFGASQYLTWNAGTFTLSINAGPTANLEISPNEIVASGLGSALTIRGDQSITIQGATGVILQGSALVMGFATEATLSTGGTQRMRITAAGNVGVGNFTVTPPAFKLDVQGDCNLSTGSVYRINGTPLALGHLDHDDLPLTDPGPGSKRLWCDPGDGYRVKFAV